MPDPTSQRPTLIAGAATGLTVGVLSPFVGGSYYGEILVGVANATSAAGGAVIAVQTLEAGSYNADFLGASGFRSPVAWDQVAGFVVVANAVSQEYLQALSAAGKPVVMVSHEYPEFTCPVVMPDNGGIREAVAHLVDHGHRRIAFVGFLSVSDVRERFEGYLETLKNLGIEPDPSLFYDAGNNHEDGGDRAARQMLAEGLPSTAVVAATDLNAIGVMRTLAAAGYRLPRDQAIVGFDDIAAARHVIPSLSSVRQSMAVLGQTAVELLLKLHDGQAVPAGRRYVPAPFVIRESCGCPDPALVEAPLTFPPAGPVVPLVPAATGSDAAPGRYPARQRLVMSLASLLTPDSSRVEEETAFTDGVEAITRLVEGAASGRGPAVAHLRHELNALYHLDGRPEHLPAMTGAVRAYGDEIANAAGFDAAADRVEECVHELTLALTEVAARTQFDDTQYFQAMLGTQYEMSMGLLRSHEEDPRGLGWLASTPARGGCLGLWSGPVEPWNPGEDDTPIVDRALEVAGVFVRGEAQSGSGPIPVTAGEFPPRQMLAVAGETSGDVVFVVPVRISSSDWGLLAVVAGVETRVPAGREIVNQSAALLAVALDHEAVVVALREQEEQLRRSAVYDGLTGLPNRTLFMDRLSLAVARKKRTGGQGFAVLFLDLDDFKEVNDRLGHDIGDQLLVGVADRMAAQLRDVDTAARFGGDEFLVLLDGIADVRSAVVAAERLQTALAHPYDLAGEQLVVTASVGIAMSDERYDVAADLLRDADIAMYSAKTRQKGTHATFDVAMHGRAMARLQFEADLRRALDHGEFALHYQPVVDLGTGSLTAFEAFLRWQHPTRGLLHPDAFLPTAEECGVIVPISRWVMREACRQLRSWQLAGVVTLDVGISVNISNRQFWHDDLLAVTIACLRDTGLGARHLALEFTEAVLMSNPRQARMMLDELRKCGVKLQIDNFGTGCSSLESLHSFQVDTLKVDRSFIARLDDPRNAEVVRTMVVMGHNLGLTLIAVGVETAEQHAQLRGLGYMSGQGYLFSRPVAAAIAERVITDLCGDSATGSAVRSA